MAAPALVALAHGSRDPRSAATIRALVDEVRAIRPDLKVEPAFLELSRPGFQTVVDRLVKAGHDEIVVVPLLLTEAHHATVDVPAAIAEATERHPQVRIQATDVLGLETCFLQVLDERLREALREARVRELALRRARRVRGSPTDNYVTFATLRAIAAQAASAWQFGYKPCGQPIRGWEGYWKP